MRKVLFVRAAFVAVAFAGAASAHHSGAMYDAQKQTTLVGTISEFHWSNPHAWIHLDVQDPATKKATSWVFESQGTNQLTRAGWKRDTLKTGDKAEVVFNPLRDGSHGGRVVRVSVNGAVLGVRPE